MSFYATERVGDAIELTREFLTPLEWGRWWRLAVIVFFLGGSGGGRLFSNVSNQGTSELPTGENLPGQMSGLPSPDSGLVPIVIGIVAAILVVILLMAILASISEFVFVESLSTDEIHLRTYYKRYARSGLRLFGFRLALALIPLVVVGIVIFLLFMLGASLTSPELGIGMVVVGGLILFPLVILGLILLGLIQGFTTEFVVPIMMTEDRTVLGAWRRLWPTIKRQAKEFVVYLLISIGLHIVTGIFATIVIFIFSFVLALPAGLLAIFLVLIVFQGGSMGTFAVVVLALIGMLYLIGVFALSAFVNVPIKVFHRQFALLVLGDTNADFDVLEQRRTALET